MEAFQPRRSDFSPVSPLHTRNRLSQGNGKVWKHRNSPRLASDSSSQAGDSADEYLFTCELGWRSSKQAVGTPIKKLLAEEMSRESESKRRSPSVIARLMGLDGLPQQQSSHKQPKKSSEIYTQRTVLTEKAQQNSTSYGSRSSRKSSKEEQEFKDVFEVLDTSKMDSSSYSSRGNVNSKLNEAEMAFIQQKFMDAKRLSTNEKLQNSKEFHDAIEDLDSNNDLLLKYLQQPDSLFTKHLHDLQGASPQSHCGRTHISVVKPLHPSQCASNGLGCKIERETSLKNRRKPHVSAVGHSYNEHEAHYSVKSSRIQLEQKDESSVVPTRIVVLKPNLGRMHNSTRTASAPHSSHGLHPDSRKPVELPSVSNSEAVSGRRKRFPDDAGPLRYKSRESREIAKEITRQMRKSLGNGSMKISTSGFRGYAGDESSSNMSEIESANESEKTSATSIDWGNRYRHSSSCSAESSVSREARKRLSDRWKLTHKSVDMGVVSRSSTLGEMLAIPDSETMPINSGDMICKQVSSDKGDCHDGTAGWGGEPLGISSRDGWKDVGIRNLSRSRSMPASSTTISSPRTGIRRENVCNERYMNPKQVIHQERNKSMKGDLNRREYSPSRSSRSRTKKSQISSCTYKDCIDTSPEIHFGLNQGQSIITEDGPYEQNCTVSETSARFITDTSSVPENVVDVAMENMYMHSKPIIDQESSTHMLGKGVSSTSDMEISSSQETLNGPSEQDLTPMQHPAAELESSASSKEADQPSPVSVLETPFPDDLSSGSECFESLNADLHGLRMQLQLLKLESEAYEEGTMLISSDEDVEERSVAFAEDLGIAKESREFSYIVDILLDSGINNADPDKFMATWHSPECPVNPLTFEELEKKYHNHVSWPRSERKLLFDSINLGVSMIYQQFADPHPWVRPATMACLKWMKKGLEIRLHELIASQDKKARKDITAEKMLATDSQWINLREEADVIVREIERLLTEELVNELVAV